MNCKKDVKGRTKIILLIDPINYVHVQEANTAKEIWQNLQRAFDDSGLYRKVNLLRNLITTTLEAYNNVEEYVNKLISTAHKFQSIGFMVEDEWLGLSQTNAIESSDMPITANSIKTKLLHEVKISDSVAFYSKSKGISTRNKYREPKGPQCFNCNKHGHISKNCRSKGKLKNKEDNPNFAAAFQIGGEQEEYGWYVDSGASMHMTKNREWLYDVNVGTKHQIGK